jgi:lysophospholipase L1-like esterase
MNPRFPMPLPRAVRTTLAALQAALLACALPAAQAAAVAEPAKSATGDAAARAAAAAAAADEAIVIERLKNDWAELRRYRTDDEALHWKAADPERVVLLGDSITDGWPKDAALWDPHFVNRGISGQTTPQMLVRLRPDVIELGARTLVLLAGTNDIAGNTGPATDEEIEGNIASIAELAHAHGIRVVLCSILPVKAYPWSPALRPAKRVLAVNAWIRAYAAKNGFTYVDYHTPMKDDEDGLPGKFADDGVHPNAAGYAVMRKLLGEALASGK